jgi:hypothetical protein
MADSISQDDLDALWGSLSGDETKEPSAAKEEKPAEAAGLAQADLDALWGPAAGTEEHPASAAPEEPAARVSENLTQDDIDKLLAEMGR